MRSVDFGLRPRASETPMPAPLNFPFGDVQVSSVMSLVLTLRICCRGLGGARGGTWPPKKSRLVCEGVRVDALDATAVELDHVSRGQRAQRACDHDADGAAQVGQLILCEGLQLG